MIVIRFAALLFDGDGTILLPAGIDGVIMSFVLEMLGFKSQRASRKHGVVLHNHAGVGIHRVCIGEMARDKRIHIICTVLYRIEYVV